MSLHLVYLDVIIQRQQGFVDANRYKVCLPSQIMSILTQTYVPTEKSGSSPIKGIWFETWEVQ